MKKIKEELELNLQLFAGEGDGSQGDGSQGDGGQGDGSQGDGTGNGAEGNGAEGGSKNDGNKSVMFTQEQVTSISAREKSQGRNSALASLGLDPSDKDLISKVKDFVTANKTKPSAGEDGSSKSAEELNAAKRELQIANAKIEALSFGVKSDYVEDAISLAIGLAAKEEGKTLKEALTTLKERYPIWFSEAQSPQKPKGTGIVPKAKAGSGDGKVSLGEKLASSTKAGSESKSFWK